MANQVFFKPMNCDLLMQPLETIVGKNRLHTHSKFSKDAKKLDLKANHIGKLRKHPESDFSHMNEEFGKLWLKEFLSVIKS